MVHFQVFDDIIDGLAVLVEVVSTEDKAGGSALGEVLHLLLGWLTRLLILVHVFLMELLLVVVLVLVHLEIVLLTGCYSGEADE